MGQKNSRASIDIGSASIKMLIQNRKGKIVFDGKIGTGLGAGMVGGGPLPLVNRQRTLQGLKQFRKILAEHQVSLADTKVITTAASRNANREITAEQRALGFATGDEFVSEIEQLGFGNARILSEREEAEVGYLGASLDHDFGKHIVVDMGGGSHQVIVGDSEQIVAWGSTQVGSHAVRAQPAAQLAGSLRSVATLPKLDEALIDLVPHLPRNSQGNRRPITIAEPDLPILLTGGFARFLRIHFAEGQVTRGQIANLRQKLVVQSSTQRRRFIRKHADGTALSPKQITALGLSGKDLGTGTSTGASLAFKATLALRLLDLLERTTEDAVIHLSNSDARHLLLQQ